MPYVICSSCETTAYTAARFTTVDDCPLCGERLPRAVTASVGAAGGVDRARSGLPFQSLNVPR
jgi:hypothetical protein